MREKIKNRWLYWFLLGSAMIIVYKLLDNFPDVMEVVGRFFDVIAPFLAGAFIAYILYIPAKQIEKLLRKSKSKFIIKKSRIFSIIFVYICILVFIILLMNVILPVVISSVIDLINNIQGYYEVTIQNYNQLPEDSILKGDIVNDLIQNVQDLDIKQYFKLDKLLAYVTGAISAVISLFDVFVAIIVSVYMLSSRAQILTFSKKVVKAFSKDKTYKSIGRYFNKTNEVFFKFIASQFLDAIIVGVLITIALSIMGVRYAPLLGFFIGIFNMIPYFGAIIATVIAAFITLITGGISQAIWMLIVVIILQQIDANIINPKIVGNSLQISPLLVIFSVTVGGAYFGVLGMFLAVPISAVVKLLIEEFVSRELRQKKMELKKAKESS